MTAAFSYTNHNGINSPVPMYANKMGRNSPTNELKKYTNRGTVLLYRVWVHRRAMAVRLHKVVC